MTSKACWIQLQLNPHEDPPMVLQDSCVEIPRLLKVVLKKGTQCKLPK